MQWARIVAIACVKNEVDIVEAFVRHTAAVVGPVVVLDNGSSDGTLDILHALRREGLPLDIVEDAAPGHYQWLRMTHLMHAFAVDRHQADWIVPVDADEFLTFPPGESPFSAKPAADRPVAISWTTYVPDSQDDPTEINPVVRIRQRLVKEPWRPAWKVLIPGKLARRADTRLAQGNHGIYGGDEMVSAELGASARLAHFPGRSPGQFAAKVAIKHCQYAATVSRSPDWGHHYRAPFELLQRAPEAFASSWREFILHYEVYPGHEFEPETVVDPFPYRGGALRYTPRIDDSSRLLKALLGHAQDLAKRQFSLDERPEFLPYERESLLRQLQAALGQRDELLREREATLRAGEDRVHAIEQEYARLRQSWTWKTGRCFVAPVTWLRARLKRVRTDAITRALVPHAGS